MGASFSRLGCFVFECFVFDRCFVFEFWVVRALVFVFECFVFETTVNLPPSTTNQKYDPDPGSDMSHISGGVTKCQLLSQASSEN